MHNCIIIVMASFKVMIAKIFLPNAFTIGHLFSLLHALIAQRVKLWDSSHFLIIFLWFIYDNDIQIIDLLSSTACQSLNFPNFSWYCLPPTSNTYLLVISGIIFATSILSVLSVTPTSYLPVHSLSPIFQNSLKLIGHSFPRSYHLLF